MSPYRFETNETSGGLFISALGTLLFSSLPPESRLKTRILIVGNGLVIDPGGRSAL